MDHLNHREFDQFYAHLESESKSQITVRDIREDWDQAGAFDGGELRLLVPMIESLDPNEARITYHAVIEKNGAGLDGTLNLVSRQGKLQVVDYIFNRSE